MRPGSVSVMREWLPGIVCLLALGCGRQDAPPREAAGGSAAAPAAEAEAWRPLVGEYERGGRRLVLLERSETLRVLLDSGLGLPVMLTADSLVPLDVPAAPRLAIARAPDGAVSALEDAGGVWTRRPLGRGTFRIAPRRPVEELRAAALAATPPVESPDLFAPDLVEVTSLDSTIRLDIWYATTDNFMGERFYESPRAFLQRPAAEALVRAHHRLEALGYGLLIHDAYRPWYATWMFWEATPDSQKVFVADPAAGSRHNRGAAVDLTLYERANGAPVPMPSGYDEFSARAHPTYPGGTTRQRWHRDLLRATLEAEGFRVYEYEWWHFDFAGWERYPILNLRFEEIVSR
jgi:D-alanyl-D-alanine dipeptidase